MNAWKWKKKEQSRSSNFRSISLPRKTQKCGSSFNNDELLEPPNDGSCGKCDSGPGRAGVVVCPRVTLRAWWKHHLLIKAAPKTWPTGARTGATRHSRVFCRNERIFTRSVTSRTSLLYLVQLYKQKAATMAGFRPQLIQKNSRKEARNTSSKIQPVMADRPKFSCHLFFFFTVHHSHCLFLTSEGKDFKVSSRHSSTSSTYWGYLQQPVKPRLTGYSGDSNSDMQQGEMGRVFFFPPQRNLNKVSLKLSNMPHC